MRVILGRHAPEEIAFYRPIIKWEDQCPLNPQDFLFFQQNLFHDKQSGFRTHTYQVLHQFPRLVWTLSCRNRPRQGVLSAAF